MKSSLSLKADLLEAEREVVLMMMLRLLGYHQVVSMCALVLDCCHDNYTKWVTLSDQMLPVILPYMAKLDGSVETVASWFRLLSVVAMKACNIRGLFELLISKPQLVSMITSCDVCHVIITGYSESICNVGGATMCSIAISQQIAEGVTRDKIVYCSGRLLFHLATPLNP